MRLSKSVMQKSPLVFLIGIIVFVFALLVWWLIYQLRAETSAGLDAPSRSLMRMLVLEGVFFLAVQIFGVAIVYGAIRREVRLKKQQENFISAVTHELKSPLTSISLFLQTLQRHDLPPEKRQEILAKMELDTRRLSDLVTNLLDASRAATGRFNPELERLDLGKMVSDFVAGLAGAFDGRPARFEVGEVKGPDVTADRRYVESILRNLVQNAVKYTRGEPIIHVSTARDGRTGVIEVADNGLGLEKGDEERIFQKFYRVGDEMVRRVPGSGLGLYLAREMARAMGGDITAESAGPGRGTTLRVFLPLAGA